MADLSAFLREIAADPVLRRAFADAPSTVLRARGYDTDGLIVPDRFDLGDLEARLQVLAALPQAAPSRHRVADDRVADGRLLRCHLNRKPLAGGDAARVGGPLTESRAVPQFANCAVSGDLPNSAAGHLSDDQLPPLKQTQDPGTSHPGAWFGSNGTAVSRALLAGDNAARLTPETIINIDDRIQVQDPSALPFRWICRLVIMAANGTLWSGTGWFISPNVIVTAGHCVYMQNQGGWVQRIDVFVYSSDGELVGPFQAQEVNSVSDWVDFGDSENDYGVIVVSRDFAQAPGHFGFGSFPDDSLREVVVNIAGFPVDKPPGTLWGHARRLSQVQSKSLYYEIDTYGGMSGAPVVCWNGQDFIAVGIHNYGDLAGNRATRINTTVFGSLQTWLADYA